MSDKIDYTEEYLPSNISSFVDDVTIFKDIEELSDFFGANKISLLSRGAEYDDVKFEVKIDKISFRIKFDFESQMFYLNGYVESVYEQFKFCRFLEEKRPDLDGKLLFSDEYGQLARFHFGLSDDQLYKHIGIDADVIEYQLMIDLGLADPEDFPPDRRP